MIRSATCLRRSIVTEPRLRTSYSFGTAKIRSQLQIVSQSSPSALSRIISATSALRVARLLEQKSTLTLGLLPSLVSVPRTIGTGLRIWKLPSINVPGLPSIIEVWLALCTRSGFLKFVPLFTNTPVGFLNYLLRPRFNVCDTLNWFRNYFLVNYVTEMAPEGKTNQCLLFVGCAPRAFAQDFAQVLSQAMGACFQAAAKRALHSGLSIM